MPGVDLKIRHRRRLQAGGVTRRGLGDRGPGTARRGLLSAGQWSDRIKTVASVSYGEGRSLSTLPR